jgi:hypothetical protein
LSRAWYALGLPFALAASCGDVTRDVITGPGSSAAGSPGGAGAPAGAGAECQTNADCPPTDRPFCDPARQRCVECLTDGYCDPGERCSPQIGECAVPCDASTSCPSDAPICDSVFGFCVECRQDSDCASGALCRDFECAR